MYVKVTLVKKKKKKYYLSKDGRDFVRTFTKYVCEDIREPIFRNVFGDSME